MDTDLSKSIKHTGTATVGFVCKDGIVLAADKRATTESFFIAHKKERKLHKITDNIVITTSGVVSDMRLYLVFQSWV